MNKIRFFPPLAAFVAAGIALTAIFSGSSSAAPLTDGALDPTFGNAGHVVTNFPVPIPGYSTDLARQSDGKIIMAGQALGYAYNNQFGLLRFNVDGSLDTSFSDDGRAMVDFTDGININGNEGAEAVAVQSNGKIVAAGFVQPISSDNLTDFAVVRFNSDGTLDTTFSGDGKVSTAFEENSGDAIHAVAIQADNKIVVAGGSRASGVGDRFALVRYLANGSLDTSFGVGGKVLTNLGYNSAARDMIVQPNGKIVVVGPASPNCLSCQNLDYTAVRYNANGTLDTTFGEGGVFSIDLGSSDDQPASVLLQPNGSIIIGGRIYYVQNDGIDIALVRITSSGDLDTTFGDEGKVITNLASNETVVDMALTTNGSILVAGASDSGSALLRYTTDGTLDSTFGDGGKLSLTSGPFISSLVLQPDNKVVLAGGGGNIMQAEVEPLVLERRNANGALDSSFGTSGRVETTFTQSVAQANDVVITPNGKILVAGSVNNYSIEGFLLARYNANGSLDNSFGNGGIVRTAFSSQGQPSYSSAKSLVLQADGKIVVVGSVVDKTIPVFALARYNADGSLDTTFNGDGKVTSPDIGVRFSADNVAVTGDGKIIIVGVFDGDFFVGRLTNNGDLDTSFDADGLVQLDGEGGGYLQSASALALASDGNIYVAGGGYFSGSNIGFVIIRLTTSGALDTTFAGDGSSHAGFLPGGATANTIALQPNGKIVLAGQVGHGENDSSIGLARFNTDGTLDSAFGSNGTVETEIVAGTGGVDAAYDLLLQSDGKILIGGESNFVLARYTTSGTLDTTFGTGGRVIAPFPGAQTIYGLALQSDGKIVAAGASITNTDNGVTLVRYQNALPPTPTATSTPTVVPTATPVTTCIFSDTCPGDYWVEPVSQLMERGAISGYSDNTFRPFNNTTRSQLAKIVVVAEGFSVQTPATATFSDVQTDNPFFGYIETAAARGIVSGYSDGTFKPFNNVTRGQLAKIIVVAEGWQVADPANPTFSDVNRDNTFFSAIETAYSHEIISGYSDGTFKWGNNATRAQIAKIVALAVTQAN